ncbi:BICD family-like cargo adapter 2 isoform X1 [Osmerus eperlanus]|uniref:BICD family-like cargo adapter 2 isoform X1 n=1 Tax=Osmerus eperlanus TaxID=29151 RepID=UPI002E10D02F
MFSHRNDSLPSPSLEDSFFPLSSSSSSLSLSLALPSSSAHSRVGEGGEGMETDLILAAELGQALLERNEELAAALEQREREVEVLQQEKHVLQRRLDMSEMTLGQREAELTSDITSLREELERHHSRGRDRRRDESEQLTQLANHNHRLVEQLAEAVSVEHSLRCELRSLKDEMDDSSFSRDISFTQLGSTQAENRVLQERLSLIEKQLASSQDDTDRLRAEREGLRERLTEMQTSLREREAELEQEQGVVFELRTLNRSLQQRALSLGEESSVENTHTHPQSLHSEIQQSQAKEAHLVYSAVLQARDEEIHTLKEELSAKQAELDSLRKDLEQFPGKPSYSSLENEVITVRQERDSLTQQLLNTIKHKVALSQEVDAWQEDMRLVISQQVHLQEEERQKALEKKKESGLQRGSRTRSLRVRGEGGKGFFSSLFRGDS